MPLSMRKTADSYLSHACAKPHPGICFQVIHSIVSNNSVSGQQRHRSDCAGALADLGLKCLHMPEYMFLHDTANFVILSTNNIDVFCLI